MKIFLKIFCLALAFSACILSTCILGSCKRVIPDRICDSLPPVWPDYDSCTVPVNVSALNFGLLPDSEYKKLYAVVSDSQGNELLKSSGRCTDFSNRRWHKALKANEGSTLSIQVSLNDGEQWVSYAPIKINISKDSIDYALTYRRIPPGYQSFGKMGIYERRLDNFNERLLLGNRMLDAGCVNCHTQNGTNHNQYCMHVRGAYSATLLHSNSVDEYLNTKTDSTGGFFVYPYWHPQGRYIAFSVNTTRQSFYSAHDKLIEVYDEASDVIVYDSANHEILRPSFLNRKDRFETKPAFSPDGKTLYFCTAEAVSMPEKVRECRYSLCSVAFDSDAGTFGSEVDTLMNAKELGLSFANPRPSYDGRFVLVTAGNFGTFMIWHPEADLWIHDVQTGENYPAGEINSTDVDSFHNWSSNSKWVVVASRRDDGLYTRLYISHIEEDGRLGKAFLLPQRNPVAYYSAMQDSYNTPDFTDGPSTLDARECRKALVSGKRKDVQVK